MSAYLDELERRGDELVAFHGSARQARRYIDKHGSGKLVAELREKRDNKRPVRLSTINALILLEHIEKLERELGRRDAEAQHTARAVASPHDRNT